MCGEHIFKNRLRTCELPALLTVLKSNSVADQLSVTLVTACLKMKKQTNTGLSGWGVKPVRNTQRVVGETANEENVGAFLVC